MLHPPSSVPEHVQTAEYLWSSTERAADKSAYAPYLTWAYAVYSQYAEVRRAGIKTVLYVNPFVPEPMEKVEFPKIMRHPELETMDCTGNAVRAYSGSSYLLDVRKAGATQFAREVVDDYIDDIHEQNPGAGTPIDLLFVDNTNEFYGMQPLPCNFDQKQWTQGVENALSQIRFPMVVNTLTVRPSVVPAKVAVLQGRNIVGVQYERCFADTQWTAEQVAQILTLQLLRRLHKPAGPGFWCYVNGPRGVGTASNVIPQRLFDYASFLLTYDPKYSVYQTAYSSPPSTFKVLPETQFVPMLPVTNATDIEQLRTSGGAYVQQFRYCYYRRKLLGSCEVAVNPNSGTAEVPNEGGYRHSIALSGNGVLDGGTVSFNGTPQDDLAPGTAEILIP